MNIRRLSAVLLLCPCLSIYSLPMFASSSQQVFAVKNTLSEEQMEEIIGSGNVDVEMADYKLGGTTAVASVANRSILYVNYEMNLTDWNGNTLETLKSGSLAPGEAVLVRGQPPYGGTKNKYIQIRAINTGLGAFEAIDTSWAVTSIDTDDDGISNADEIEYGLNPYDGSDAELDFDSDGLSNKDEILVYHTDINNPDTDGDTIFDGLEVANGLNPKWSNDANLDPDRDFVSNADEINIHGSDINIYTAGLAPDADEDGLNDVLETAFGTDPDDSSANDVGGNTGDDKEIMHILNRLTFGPTNDLVNDITAMGVEDWVADQMVTLDYVTLSTDPSSDPAQQLRVDFPTSFNNMERVGAIRPLHSVKQLQARMAHFWDNHFNTFKNKTGTESELHEEDLFFANALGNFRNLLDASAKSDAMMRYLDLRGSRKPAPNENYAREVMELHTFGVTTSAINPATGNPYYLSEDVDALSRILSGWSTSNDDITNPDIGITLSLYGVSNNIAIQYRNLYKFIYYPGRHDDDEKTFLGTVFPAGGGQAEGEAALDLLAESEITARNICTKMAKTFVSDQPNGDTISDCVSLFMENQAASDQIALVLQSLISSDEFQDEGNQRAKFKDTQEYMFSLARFKGVNAVGNVQIPGEDVLNGTAFGNAVTRSGQGMFNKAPPTGYKEEADEWINGNTVINRTREGNTIVYSSAYSNDLVAYFAGLGLSSSKDVLGHVFKLMLGGHYDLKHMEMGYWVLHKNGSSFDVSDSNAGTKLKNLVARVAQLPEFNLH